MSWDGSGSDTSPGETVGPDFMRVRLLDGPVLLYHTFSNIPDDDRFSDDMKIQTYPSPVPGQPCRARQGAAVEDSLGYFMRIRTRGRGIPMDTTYRFSYVFPHIADSADIEFRAIGLQYAARGKVDESWGIDRVVVEALDEPDVTPPTEAEAADLLKSASAADSDPDAADNAYRHLLQGGPAVRAVMLKALRDDGFDRAAIDTLKQDMGSPDAATRDRAKSQLAKLPGLRELILRELELDGESPEVRESATSQLKILKPLTDPKDRRAAVAARVLQVIAAATAP
jgi:hypothetical protein